jgi:hypothetical protein
MSITIKKLEGPIKEVQEYCNLLEEEMKIKNRLQEIKARKLSLERSEVSKKAIGELNREQLRYNDPGKLKERDQKRAKKAKKVLALKAKTLKAPSQGGLKSSEEENEESEDDDDQKLPPGKKRKVRSVRARLEGKLSSGPPQVDKTLQSDAKK